MIEIIYLLIVTGLIVDVLTRVIKASERQSEEIDRSQSNGAYRYINNTPVHIKQPASLSVKSRGKGG